MALQGQLVLTRPVETLPPPLYRPYESPFSVLSDRKSDESGNAIFIASSVDLILVHTSVHITHLLYGLVPYSVRVLIAALLLNL